MNEGVTLRKKAELFNIRLDVGDKRDRKCQELLSIPFNLPSGLLPTLIEKDQSAKVFYHIQVSTRYSFRHYYYTGKNEIITVFVFVDFSNQVSAYVGKKEDCCITLPLILVSH